MTLNQILISIVFLLILGIVGIVTLIILESKKKKGRISRALNMSLFLITLPKKIRKEEREAVKTEKEIISVMEQFYSSLSNIKETKDTFIYGQPYLIFEIATPYIGEEISFYMSVPHKYEAVIEKQIHGFYPGASFKKVEDYNIFNPKGAVAGSYLKLSKNYILPFKTYQELESDPLNEIANALSKLEEKGEGAAIQIVFRPSSFNWQKTGKEVAKEMQKGKSFSEAMSSNKRGIISGVVKELGEIVKSTKQEEKLEENREVITPGQEEIVKALEGKVSKAGFEVNIRLITSGKNDNQAEQLLSHLENAFVQFNTQNFNQLKSIRLKRRALKKIIYDFSFRTFNKKNSIILNTEELTSLFHFPSNAIDAPNVKFAKSQSSALPINMLKQGDPEVAQNIKELSRLKYGRDKSVVDQEISERYKKQI